MHDDRQAKQLRPGDIGTMADSNIALAQAAQIQIPMPLPTGQDTLQAKHSEDVDQSHDNAAQTDGAAALSKHVKRGRITRRARLRHAVPGVQQSACSNMYRPGNPGLTAAAPFAVCVSQKRLSSDAEPPATVHLLIRSKLRSMVPMQQLMQSRITTGAKMKECAPAVHVYLLRCAHVQAVSLQ